MIYPVLVIPTLATYTSPVMLLFLRASQMYEFAMLIGRYLVKAGLGSSKSIGLVRKLYSIATNSY
jgi:hypothetical protein